MNSLHNDWFISEVPGKPMGYYAHIILLRVTDSYPLLQTDGELNTARVQAGTNDQEIITRLTFFKRKQSTPERLKGRELLRRYSFLSSKEADGDDVDESGLSICDYNVAFCTQCPDCITYGFAIGDRGSEKSKVITDTAYSLTAYDHSHEAFTLNAPYEDGTMTRHGEVTGRINEQDHVRPQVVFPAVITTRDLPRNLFLYVLNNVLRTKRYGAQTTRTGRVNNHIVVVALTDGEVFSNLLFTQRLHDALQEKEAINPPDPVDLQVTLETTRELIPRLLLEDGVTVDQLLIDKDMEALLEEMRALSADQESVTQLLSDAFDDSRAYHKAWVAKK